METREAIYSIAIEPNIEGIAYVDKLKEELNLKVGWFHSRNSKAHITIAKFTADENTLGYIINRLKEVSSYEKPVWLSFSGVGNYANGAVFLKPNDATKIPLTELMVRVQKKLNIKNSYKSKDPHISIGRKLTEHEILIALNMFSEVKLDFLCSNIVLRRRYPKQNQYEILFRDFEFLGNTPKPNPQQSLF